MALRPEANRIEIAKSVYETCRFIDDVEGRQGGPLVQAFTPDQDIKLGERNALLNEVLRKGADTVILNSMNVGTLAVADPHTMSDQKRMTGEHHDHDSRLRGRAYQCNADELAHRVSK